jgi:hypothetical protein
MPVGKFNLLQRVHAMNALFGDISNIISLSITPAFLMLGVMLLLRVLNNRLDRIIDRRDVLELRLAGGAGQRSVLHHELGILCRRADVIHRAVGTSTACMLLVCAVVVALFADDALQLKLSTMIAFLFVGAMLLLITSFSLFMHEIFIASHSMPSTALHRARQPDGQR